MRLKCKCVSGCAKPTKRVCYEKIKYGPMGLRGETGATGPTGATGATGLSAENFIARTTTTLDAGENARVEKFSDEKNVYFDFYIPKGADGKTDKLLVGYTETIEPDKPAQVLERCEDDMRYIDFFIPKGMVGAKGEKGDKGESEAITIDGTETIEPEEEASVLDDFDGRIHHLTFYIPRGETGEKGERGIDSVRAGNTTQVESGEPAKVEDRIEGNVHFLDFQIPKGEKGEKGEEGDAGVAGPPGLTPDYNATVYNALQQIVEENGTLALTTTDTANRFTLENNSLKVPLDGTYLISFSINNSLQAEPSDTVGVAINGNMVYASKRPLTTSTNTSGTIVKKLNRNDVVTLQSRFGGSRTITGTGAPSAMLTIVLIAI